MQAQRASKPNQRDPSPLDLLGTWILSRRIEDRRAGEVLTVAGTTELVALGPDEVAWHEVGQLHRPGHHPVQVTRRLSVVRREGGWWVRFDHGGDFHPWQPGREVEHPCGDDLYRGLVEIDSAHVWTVTWQVSGPGKDYTMHSALTRPTVQ